MTSTINTVNNLKKPGRPVWLQVSARKCLHEATLIIYFCTATDRNKPSGHIGTHEKLKIRPCHVARHWQNAQKHQKVKDVGRWGGRMAILSVSHSTAQLLGKVTHGRATDCTGQNPSFFFILHFTFQP